MRQDLETVDLTIVVSGNTGNKTFTALGILKVVAIKAPNAATFDYDISDQDGFGIVGATNLSGDTALSVDRPCMRKSTFTLSNATNGTYSIRLSLLAGI